MSAELRRQIDPLLPRYERVLWAGQPRMSRFLAEVLPLLVFALPFTAFALFWEWGVLFGTGGFSPFKLIMAAFGLPFVGVGLWLFAKPLGTLSRARRTAYAVTNRRALLVDLRSELVRGYGPEAITEIRRAGRGDLIFTADRVSESFFPAASSEPAKGAYLPVGFAGLADVDGAQAQLEALMSEKRERGEEAPGNPMRARRSEAGEGLLTSNGTYAAFLTKLRASVRVQQEQLAARQRKAWTIFQTVVGAIALLILIGAGHIAREESLGDAIIAGLFLVTFFGIFAAGAGLVMHFMHKAKRAEVERDNDFRQVLQRLEPDVHPKSPLLGFADLGEADDTRPVRTRKSPHSGATKTYHKHHWGQLAWAFADGAMLALNLVDKVKYKAGAEVKRSHHVRGRLRVERSRCAAELPASFRCSKLEVRAHEQDGRLHLCFTGALDGVTELPEELEALYRRLEPAPVRAAG